MAASRGEVRPAEASAIRRPYSGALLRTDVIAGLIAATVVVPKAVAYATIAGLPVQIGLYTALIPMVVYAVLGTSPVLSVSTTTTIAILTGAELALAAPGAGTAGQLVAVATLSVLVGMMLIVAGAIRLGFVANFISEPVLTGFKTGIGLVIVVDQLPKLFGLHIDKAGFFRDLLSIVQQLPDTSVPTLLLAIILVALMLSLERFAPSVPAPLVAIGGAIAASALLDASRWGIEVIGDVAEGLPTLVRPRLDLLASMWPAAAGIALMSFTESVAAARAFAITGEPRPAPNRELLATGLANVAGGLFGAMPSGGGTTQTAVNRKAGARSQVAALVTAGLALATLVAIAPIIGLMPQAALAAVVIVYSVDLIKPAEFLNIRRVRRTEFRWAIIAAAGVMVLGTLQGILVAVIASLLALAHQAYDPPVHVVGRKRGTDVFRPRSSDHPDDEFWPDLLVLRVEGRAFFLNAQRIGDRMWQEVEIAQPSVLLIDGSALIDIEYTALKMLDEAERRLARRGITLWLAALTPQVLRIVQQSPLGERLGRERMFFTVEAAVGAHERASHGSGVV
jgi:high affinity sulfate transporter 1